MKRKPFGRLGRIEELENRRLMAVDVLSALPDQAVAPGAAPAVISLADADRLLVSTASGSLQTSRGRVEVK